MPAKKSRLRRVLAVDLGGTNVRVGVADSRGKVLYLEKTATPRHPKKEAVLRHMAWAIQNVLNQARKKGWPISGIAIGCPGPVSSKTGVVYHAPNVPGWKNVPVKQYFQRRFKIPVTVENDANAAALAEAWAGAGRGSSSSITLTLGTGVGGGVVLNGEVWHGANDIAGEIGHMVSRLDGEKCKCGNRGCLELYTSAPGIVRRTRMALHRAGKKTLNGKSFRQLTCKDVYDAAKKGDPLAQKITRETAEILGAALTSLVHLLNPQALILGGGVAENGSLLFVPLRRAVRRRAFPQATRRLKIVPARLGDHAGMIGAARAFFLEHP